MLMLLLLLLAIISIAQTNAWTTTSTVTTIPRNSRTKLRMVAENREGDRESSSYEEQYAAFVRQYQQQQQQRQQPVNATLNASERPKHDVPLTNLYDSKTANQVSENNNWNADKVKEWMDWRDSEENKLAEERLEMAFLDFISCYPTKKIEENKAWKLSEYDAADDAVDDAAGVDSSSALGNKRYSESDSASKDTTTSFLASSRRTTNSSRPYNDYLDLVANMGGQFSMLPPSDSNTNDHDAVVDGDAVVEPETGFSSEHKHTSNHHTDNDNNKVIEVRVETTFPNGISVEDAKQGWLDFCWERGGGIVVPATASKMDPPTADLTEYNNTRELIVPFGMKQKIVSSTTHRDKFQAFTIRRDIVVYKTTQRGLFCQDMIKDSHNGTVEFIGASYTSTRMIWTETFQIASNEDVASTDTVATDNTTPLANTWGSWSQSQIKTASQNLMAYLDKADGSIPVLEHIETLPIDVSPREAMEVWYNHYWKKGGGAIPFLVSPMIEGSDNNTQWVLPSGLEEELVSLEYDHPASESGIVGIDGTITSETEIAKAVYKVNNPNPLTYPVLYHRASVRFVRDSKESPTQLIWRVKVKPFQKFLVGRVLHFTKSGIATVAQKLRKYLELQNVQKREKEIRTQLESLRSKITNNFDTGDNVDEDAARSTIEDNIHEGENTKIGNLDRDDTNDAVNYAEDDFLQKIRENLAEWETSMEEIASIWNTTNDSSASHDSDYDFLRPLLHDNTEWQTDDDQGSTTCFGELDKVRDQSCEDSVGSEDWLSYWQKLNQGLEAGNTPSLSSKDIQTIMDSSANYSNVANTDDWVLHWQTLQQNHTIGKINVNHETGTSADDSSKNSNIDVGDSTKKGWQTLQHDRAPESNDRQPLNSNPNPTSHSQRELKKKTVSVSPKSSEGRRLIEPLHREGVRRRSNFLNPVPPVPIHQRHRSNSTSKKP